MQEYRQDESIDLAVIGGTGLTELENLEITHREVVHTPWGEPSGALTHGRISGCHLVFLARHGYTHRIPPHQVNYRANIWALSHVGVKRVLAVNAVGGIRDDLVPGMLAVPDQLIDYTWGRAHTFFEGELKEVVHTDFTWPYDPELRRSVVESARACDVPVTGEGVYAATQGPRLETAAEIDRLERDGANMVGMTGMPEAILARELDLRYACCAVVANRAAGRGKGEITMKEIEEALRLGMERVRRTLEALLTRTGGG